MLSQPRQNKYVRKLELKTSKAVALVLLFVLVQMSSELESLVNGERKTIKNCNVKSETDQELLKIQENIFYIVAVVVVNHLNHVLMMQEAKSSCYGKWYLPAGKMEPNETIVEAAKREMMEETGLEIVPTDVLCVEDCGGRWVRFTLTGKITGGTLKTEDTKDDESLQAMWWDPNTPLPLRARDVLPLIQRGLEYHKNLKENARNLILPTLQPQSLFVLRVLAVHKCEKTSTYKIMTINSTFPTTQVSMEDNSIHPAMTKLVNRATIDETRYSIVGLTGIEYGAEPQYDGICLNTFVLINEDNLPPLAGGFEWTSPSPATLDTVMEIINNKIRTIPIISLKVNKK